MNTISSSRRINIAVLNCIGIKSSHIPFTTTIIIIIIIIMIIVIVIVIVIIITTIIIIIIIIALKRKPLTAKQNKKNGKTYKHFSQ